MTTAEPKKPVLLMGGLAAVFVALIVALIVLVNNGPKEPVVASKTTGEALIGGPFTLVNHEGRTVSEADYADRYKLFYFGFTFCPDVCPMALQIMAAALDALGPDADKIYPLFVSVDPERDTFEAMGPYVEQFHDRMIGLTGTPEQIAAVTKAYRVYARKVSDPGSSAAYTMDHSSVFYLMSPEGDYVTHFTHVTDPEEMAQEIRSAVGVR